ncbi:MAG: hypothetical protein WB507_03195 [Solirubrobacterales bacterium]
MKHPADQFASEVEDPCIYTFAAHLPFALGLPDRLGHSITFEEPFADPQDTELFGPRVFTDIRLFTHLTPGLPAWPPGVTDALRRFYDFELDDDPEARYGEDDVNAHEQWVSLETPGAPTAAELGEDDPGFAFHRSLKALNLFLRVLYMHTHDIRIRPITTHDLRPVVVLGAWTCDRRWHHLTDMLMHPEAGHDALPPSGPPITEAKLKAGLAAVGAGKPYLTTSLWRARAQRALRRGDPADAIISYQVTAESLLFDTYRMLLVDGGISAGDLDSKLNSELPFKTLLIREMPPLLGGSWDVTRTGSPIGNYWHKLYLVRNRIVHAGLEPHGGHAQDAEAGYRALRDHLEDRLRANQTRYPRTVLARLGPDGFADGGRVSRRMRKTLASIKAEVGPWYWPYDQAGRESPKGSRLRADSEKS